MPKRVLQFLYTGENERPVRAVNFRMKEQGGLGLIHPVWKARAFLVKNMIKEYLNTENNEDSIKIEKVYGYTEDMESVINAEIGKDVKSIYNHLMKSILEKNGSLIPSRNEKKVSGIKWNLVWKNQNLVKGITGSERVFVWKCTQDMLEVGDRIHRKNANRNCRREKDGKECTEREDMKHCLSECEVVKNSFDDLKEVLEEILEREITTKEVIYYAYNHRNKKRLKMALWLATKMLYNIYIEKNFNGEQIWKNILKEIEWNIKMQTKLGSNSEIIKMKMVIDSKVKG